jgi:hypothetical protein
MVPVGLIRLAGPIHAPADPMRPSGSRIIVLGYEGVEINT